MEKSYDIQSKIRFSRMEYANPVLEFQTNILDYCPIETKFLFPGKLYVFEYHKKSSDKLYDTNPYVMSLGPKEKDNTFFYAINMHHIPYKIRLQIFEYLYDTFYKTIEKEILAYPNPEDAERQKYLKYVNTDLITKSPFNVNIGPCIKKYDIKLMSDCKLVNYNLIHYMLQSEDDRFENGCIEDAQEEFIENMLKAKPQNKRFKTLKNKK